MVSCNAISVARDTWYPLLNSSEVDLIGKDGENLPTAAPVTGILQQQQALLPKEKLKITIIYNILIQTKVMFTQNN